ncbi:103_t:CDS:2, partial [Racocetra persica]
QEIQPDESKVEKAIRNNNGPLGNKVHRLGSTHWNVDVLSRVNGTEDEIAEVYMVVGE